MLRLSMDVQQRGINTNVISLLYGRYAMYKILTTPHFSTCSTKKYRPISSAFGKNTKTPIADLNVQGSTAIKSVSCCINPVRPQLMALPTYSTSKRSVELGGMTQEVGSHPLHPAPFSP